MKPTIIIGHRSVNNVRHFIVLVEIVVKICPFKVLRIETVLIVIEYLKKIYQHFLYRMICIKDNGGWMVTNMSDLSCSSSIILVLYSVKL